MIEDYYESQRMKNSWVWLIISVAQGLLLWGLIQQVIMEIPWGKKPTSDTMLIVSNCFVLFTALMMVLLKMEVRINSDGVRFRYPPFQWKWKKIDWADVSEVHVIHYSLLDYGGWGSLWGGANRGWGYCVSGNRGIRFLLKDGEKIMLGTKRPEKVEKYLEILEKDLSPENTFLFAH